MRDKSCRQEPGRRDDTCDHGLSRSWKAKVCKKKKKTSVYQLLDPGIDTYGTHQLEMGTGRHFRRTENRIGGVILEKKEAV